MSTINREYRFLPAAGERDYSIARELFIEYANTLNFKLCFQDFDKELAQLNRMYNMPYGGIILVKDNNSDEFIGCVVIRKFEENIAELKRVYIREIRRH